MEKEDISLLENLSLQTDLEKILLDPQNIMMIEELFLEILNSGSIRFNKITPQFRKKYKRMKIGFLSEEMITKIFKIKNLKRLIIVIFQFIFHFYH